MNRLPNPRPLAAGLLACLLAATALLAACGGSDSADIPANMPMDGRADESIRAPDDEPAGRSAADAEAEPPPAALDVAR